MNCTLAADVNKCPFYDRETGKCNNKGKCSFQVDDIEKNNTGYVREERWYEKYYRKK